MYTMQVFYFSAQLKHYLFDLIVADHNSYKKSHWDYCKYHKIYTYSYSITFSSNIK